MGHDMKKFTNTLIVFIVITIALGFSKIKISKSDLGKEAYTDNKEVSPTNDTLTDIDSDRIPQIPHSPSIVKKWILVWNDEFNNKFVDEEKWNVVNRKESYNNELQYYNKKNVMQSEGYLKLIGKRETLEEKEYTSGLVDTRGKFTLQYGKIEVRAKNPFGKGLFPAIWLLPNNGTVVLPEIDIMEMVGNEPEVIYGASHYLENGNYERTFNKIPIANPQDFHVYTLVWDKKEVKWFIDDTLFHSTSKGIPQEPMYLIMNLAIGGIWPGNPDRNTIFPSEFIIDYVRIYKSNEMNGGIR